MGKFDGKFIRGLVGGAIFKEYRGTQVVQGKSKKKKIKRTVATKKSASVFGKASSLAGYIRMELDPLISDFYDGTMIFRFTTEVLYCLRLALDTETQNFKFSTESFNRIIGFEFNTNSPLKNNFFIQPAISTEGNNTRLTLPGINIPKDLKFPNGISYCKVVICSAMLDLTYGHFTQNFIQSFDVSLTPKPTIIPQQQWEFDTAPGCLCVIGIALQFFKKTATGDLVINSKSFGPSGILNAFITDGEVDLSKTKKWHNMPFKAIE